MLIQTLGIIDTLEEWITPVREWLFKHYSNPILWLGIFIVLLLIFKLAYVALQKEK